MNADAELPANLPARIDTPDPVQGVDPIDWAGRAEEAVLDAALRFTADAPWNDALVWRAAAAAGLSRADATLLFPGGARDLAALLSRRHDLLTLQRLQGVDVQTLKVRERIRTAVEARVEAAMADEAAVRRVAMLLARPDHAGFGLRLAWASADDLWRWAGDVSTDENHYSKRALLAAILVSTVAVRLAAGRARASAHLEARIADVMRFEKWKAGLPRAEDALTALAGGLGRLRYGRREAHPSADV